MTVVCVGLNHRTASLDLLERISIGPDRIGNALDGLLKSEHITEAAIVSTCLRTEVYVEAVRFHGAVADVRDLLARMSGIPIAEVSDGLFEFFDEAAYAHLFGIAAGVESAVLGESEVLGQVARALDASRAHGACRSVLSPLLRHAVKVGKRARSETAIARGVTSIGQAAVVMATERVGGLSDKKVLLLGAGQMGEGMALTVSRNREVSELMVCNRTPTTASELAARIGARAVAFEDLPGALDDIDLVLASTGASEPVLDLPLIERVMSERPKPLVIVDMGVPRDVDSAVADVEGVTLLDLEDLRSFTAVAHSGREREVNTVRLMIDEEVRSYVHGTAERSMTPLVRDIRDRAEILRIAELQRHAARLESLTPEQRAAVDQLTKGLLAKLLHEPTVRLKDAAGTAEGERMAAALRYLLDI